MSPKQVYSINLYLRELIHLLAFTAAGFFPWYRPYNWVVIVLYIWFKEAYWDPINDTGKTWWELDYGDVFYSWGDGKWINYKVKGILDAVVCVTGGLVGTILYIWLLGG